jgi:hypothetical protein
MAIGRLNTEMCSFDKISVTMPTHWCSILVLVLTAVSCRPENPDFQQDAAEPEYYHRAVKKLTDVIVHDIFSPPVASRIYSYASIAGYEAIIKGNPAYRSFSGVLRDLPPIPNPDQGLEYCYPVAGMQAFLNVGKTLIFSEEKIDSFHQEMMETYRQMGVPREVMNRSTAYGDTVAAHILRWAASDNYSQTRSFPKFSLSNSPAVWQPTPPAYMDGIEPHWGKIRPFLLDSAAQFAPPPPPAFDMSKGSEFHTQVMEAYQVMQDDPNREKEAIASFWDCNPYVSHQIGHVMFATKKITPGGHWINIVAVAARKAGARLETSAQAYVFTSVTLMDGFISCWDEKYRSKLVRPETVINEYIDEDWLPTLQTPPFPEYTSGHSVISNASAYVLTQFFGDNFAFTDDTEVEFGLPIRNFRSFNHAADEASLSRLYGGIHFRAAIENGVQQGLQVGAHAWTKLQPLQPKKQAL